MSTTYYLICEKHNQITPASDVSGSGRCAIAGKEEALAAFIASHRSCTLRVLGENDEEMYPFWYRQPDAPKMWESEEMLYL